jgi:hypothetical protein
MFLKYVSNYQPIKLSNNQTLNFFFKILIYVYVYLYIYMYMYIHKLARGTGYLHPHLRFHITVAIKHVVE